MEDIADARMGTGSGLNAAGQLTPAPRLTKLMSRNKNPYAGRLYRAGEKLAGMTVAHSGLGLARGDLGRRAGLAGREPRFLNEAAP